MDNFIEESTTVWNFEDRGNWATHKGDYPGNSSPRATRNLILKYSKKDDVVLDQFIGSGTTAIESLLLGRRIIGVDINNRAIDITKSRIKNIHGDKNIYRGNAETLNLPDNSIDFICTHPPYLNIIKYSKDIIGDLSLMTKADYYKEMNKIASESFRVLKQNSKCAIIIGDVRKNGLIEPLGFNVMKIFLDKGFKLKETIIKVQHNCNSTSKWIEIAKQKNFLLLQHEFIFVFQK